jgi:hypothetical protein
MPVLVSRVAVCAGVQQAARSLILAAIAFIPPLAELSAQTARMTDVRATLGAGAALVTQGFKSDVSGNRYSEGRTGASAGVGVSVPVVDPLAIVVTYDIAGIGASWRWDQLALALRVRARGRGGPFFEAGPAIGWFHENAGVSVPAEAATGANEPARRVTQIVIGAGWSVPVSAHLVILPQIRAAATIHRWRAGPSSSYSYRSITAGFGVTWR